MMSLLPNSSYTMLVSTVSTLLENAKKTIHQHINMVLVKTYWEIGRYIVEYEQKGCEKAKYGSSLLQNMAKDLTLKFGKGFSVQNLERMRQLYLSFPMLLSKKSPTLLRKLNRSHFLHLMSIKDLSERDFYVIETSQNNRSVRELRRQIDSSLYERLLLSKNKKDVLTLAKKGQIIQNSDDLIKDPYVLEFLGLQEQTIYTENDLELAIINNLQRFLLELGKGFTFVSRQQRITNGPDHYFIDLVFYNRLLQCFFLIDLKIGKLKHQDIGQMQMYVHYYDRNIKNKGEKPTIGMILCKENDDFVIEYTLPSKHIYAKEYKLYLPNKNELKKQLEKVL